METTFEEWFDIFIDKCSSLGYDGAIDKGTFEFEHENGMSPEESAISFVKEMTE